MVQPRVNVEVGPWILRALIRAPGPKRFDKSGILFFFFLVFPPCGLQVACARILKLAMVFVFLFFFFVLLDHSLQYDTLCF